MFKTLVDLLKHLTDLEDELNEYEDNAPDDLIIEYNETEEQVMEVLTKLYRQCGDTSKILNGILECYETIVYEVINDIEEKSEGFEDEAEDNVKEFKNEAIEKIKLLLKRLDNI